MEHAELVMIHPEEFYRHAQAFLAAPTQTEAARQNG